MAENRLPWVLHGCKKYFRKVTCDYPWHLLFGRTWPEEASMSDIVDTVNQSIFDSAVRFPFIRLEDAIGRAKELYDAAAEHDVTVPAAFETWKYSAKSSGGNQTISALKMYGLLSDIGHGEKRKLVLSDKALRFFRDEREDVLAQLKREFAVAPALFGSLWEKWGATPPADNIARSHLKVDRGMAEQNARSVLNIYKENIVFADLKGAGKLPSSLAGKGSVEPPPTVKVGDYVQWTSNGVDQFKPVRKVTKVEDGHVWVFGNNTGIPMQEVAVTHEPTPKSFLEAGVDATLARTDQSQEGPQIDVLLRGNRLQITADVDAAGLAKLKDVLAKYEEILKLLDK
jgi:hypothetical protein